MIKVGLTSVTFNDLSALDVISYAKACRINAIEWGSNVHVPIEDTMNANCIKEECDINEIKVSSYGSYYTCGEYENAEEEFAKYIEIAKILEAPKIRIWVGTENYEDATEEYIEKVVSELKIICNMAKKENIEIGCELHNGTLCNKKDSSLEMVKRVDCDNFGMYFQYDWNVSIEENLETLKSFLPILKNVHVFNADDTDGFTRYSLGEHGGIEMWKEFIGILKDSNVQTTLLFEFLAEPTEENLKMETEILRDILNKE